MASSAGAIRAGRAFVEVFLDRKKFDKGLAGIGSTLKGAGRGIFGFGAAITGFGAALTAGFLATIPAAADAEESINRFNQVFGEQADAAKAFAEQLARDVGRSSVDIMDSMSSFQSLFVGLGFDPKQALQMSETLQTLALDFASFNNLSDGEAMQRFISGLSGSSEVFDRFGINTKAAAIDAELMAMGINKTTATASEQEKTMARLSIIYKSMGRQGAIGDAVRTSDSWTNSMKRLMSSLKDVRVAIGQGVIAVLTPFLGLLNKIVTPTVAWIKEHKKLVGVLFLTALGITAVGSVIMGFGALMIFAGAAIGGLAALIGVVFTPIGGILFALTNAIVLTTIAFAGIAAAVAAPIAAFFAFTDAGRSMWGKITMYLGAIWTTTSKVFGGIFTALTSGQWGAAANIAWLGVKLAFAEGGLAIINGFMFVVETIGKFWEGGLMGMGELFMQFVRFFLKISMQMTQGLASSMMGNTEAAMKAFGSISGPAFESVNFLTALIGDPTGTLEDLRDKTRMELEAALAALESPATAAQEEAKQSFEGAQDAARAASAIADTRGTFNGIAASRAFGFAAGNKNDGAKDETLQDTNGLLEQILSSQPLVLGGAS